MTLHAANVIAIRQLAHARFVDDASCLDGRKVGEVDVVRKFEAALEVLVNNGVENSWSWEVSDELHGPPGVYVLNADVPLGITMKIFVVSCNGREELAGTHFP